MPQKNLTIDKFPFGLIDSIEDSKIPSGAASAVKNWLARGDVYELRRGQLLINDDGGVGKSRVFIATNKGTEVKFKISGKKLYYDSDGWVEIGTDVLTTDGDSEDVAFREYHGAAGDQVWIGSPYVLLKIMTANPSDYASQYLSGRNYKGYIDIDHNRMTLWGRLADRAGVRLSKIDTLNYTSVTDETLDTGDGGKNYLGTAAFKAGGARRTCFAVVVNDEDEIETFTDNGDGTLTGSAGGTGTINYMTGAVIVVFAANVTAGKAIHIDYSWEDSADGGIADFRESGTRLAGEGAHFPQGSGGDLLAVINFKDTKYCFHETEIWRLVLSADDTNAINEPFRKNTGIPHWRAAFPTSEGIFYIDDSDKKDPKFRRLRYDIGSDQVIPESISDGLDLADYRFNQSCVFKFGDMIIFSCRHKDHTYNDTQFILNMNLLSKVKLLQNKIFIPWDKTDYTAQNFDIYTGALWMGDSLVKNVYQIFDGLDDDEANILNHLEFNLTDLGIDFLKKLKQLVIEGNIGIDQLIRVYGSFDGGTFVELGAIDGRGDYVDAGTSINVGAVTIGRSEVGGGGAGILAYHYLRKIKLVQDKFRRVKLKFVAEKLGWADISMINYKDIRLKSKKLPERYR